MRIVRLANFVAPRSGGLRTSLAELGAGYLAACAVAAIVVHVYIAATNGPDRQTYSGMFAFGDSMLFLGVWALAALPATGAALFFLRPYPTFWRIVSVGAFATAMTAVAALAISLVPPNTDWGSFLGVWSAVSPLRILLAPLLALACLLSVVFAPTRCSRIALLCASVIETVVFVWVALRWFHPLR